jgi:PAS domain S-box-containing protein
MTGSPLEKQAEHSMQDKTILIVEDQAIIAMTIEEDLGQLGYGVAGIASTGEEAIKLAREKKPDLILMDIRISGDIDGIQATRAINEFSDVPVIFLTAHTDDETANEILKTCAYSCLIKPYNPRELFLTIEFSINRHRLEKKLRESENRFRNLFDGTLDLVQIIRPDGSFLHVNPAWKKHLGYSDEDMKTLSIFDIIHPDSMAHCIVIFRDVISGDEARTIETEFLTKDGKTISVVGNCSPELKDGTVVTLRGIFQDVSDRKQAEAAIVEAEKRFHSVFDNVQDGLLVADMETRRFVMANAGIQKQLGYTETELLSMSVDDIHPAADLPEVIGQFGKMTEGEIDQSSDIPVLSKDGTVFFADINNSFVTLQGRRYILGIFRDITKRKTAQAALQVMTEYLKKRQQEYRNLFLLNTEAMLILDPDFSIIFANPAAEKIFGRSSEALSGVPFGYPVITGELTEIEIPRRDGTVALCNMRTSVISWEDKPANMVIIRDITERKLMEQKIRESEESFRGLFNTVGEAIFVIDVDGRFLEVNQGALDMYEQPRDFFIGQSPDILFSPGTFDMGLTINRLEKAFNHEPQHFEFTGCRGSGELFPAECRLYRGLYSGKDVVIGLELDITERRKAEEALRKSEELNLLYIKEAAMRLRNPIELVQQSISLMIMDIESGEYTSKEIIPQLQQQVMIMEQIRKNILDLNKTIIEGFGDISPESKKFLTE